MSQYKLIYFDVRGVAEPIRQILVYSGTPFEDVRIPLGGLTQEKKEELGLEWGQVPVLEVDGKMKSQSYIICRYLGEKFNIAGKNEEERFRCAEVADAYRDYYMKAQPVFANFFGNDQAKLEESKKTFAEVDSPVYLARFNKFLQKQGKTWTVGDSLTWTDILLVHGITTLETAFDLQLAKGYPAIEKLINAVHNEPKIKEWIKKRPVTKL